jgi:hypothetical protein
MTISFPLGGKQGFDNTNVIEHTSYQVGFDALNQHFITQYKNTGSYYRKMFS